MYAYMALVLLALGGAAGAYWQGREDGRSACESAQARDDRVAKVASDAAASAAAGAIGRISVRHTTIRQEVEREIQIRPEYRDCRHSAEQLQRINSALSPAGPEPAGAGPVPAADAAGR